MKNYTDWLIEEYNLQEDIDIKAVKDGVNKKVNLIAKDFVAICNKLKTNCSEILDPLIQNNGTSKVGGKIYYDLFYKLYNTYNQKINSTLLEQVKQFAACLDPLDKAKVINKQDLIKCINMLTNLKSELNKDYNKYNLNISTLGRLNQGGQCRPADIKNEVITTIDKVSREVTLNIYSPMLDTIQHGLDIGNK